MIGPLRMCSAPMAMKLSQPVPESPISISASRRSGLKTNSGD